MKHRCEGIGCKNIGKYQTDIGYFCGIHLRKIRAFSKNPIDTKTGNQIDRNKLFYYKIIEEIIPKEEK